MWINATKEVHPKQEEELEHPVRVGLKDDGEGEEEKRGGRVGHGLSLRGGELRCCVEICSHYDMIPLTSRTRVSLPTCYWHQVFHLELSQDPPPF